MITQSKIQVFTTQAMTTQVGNTVTTNSDAETVHLGLETLGVNLNGGTRYWARAQATGTGGTSEWSEPTPFITMIDATLRGSDVDRNSVELSAVLGYDDHVIRPVECGYFLSKYNTGFNYTIHTAADEAELYAMDIDGLEEGRQYWYVAYVIDDQLREWDIPWADAGTFTTGYTLPIVIISAIDSGEYWIGGTAEINSVSPVITAVAKVSDGVNDYMVDVVGDSFTFKNGTPDKQGNTIRITSGTWYNITVQVTNSGGVTTSKPVRVMTVDGGGDTIEVKAVDTQPTAARVRLIFG